MGGLLRIMSRQVGNIDAQEPNMDKTVAIMAGQVANMAETAPPNLPPEAEREFEIGRMLRFLPQRTRRMHRGHGDFRLVAALLIITQRKMEKRSCTEGSLRSGFARRDAEKEEITNYDFRITNYDLDGC